MGGLGQPRPVPRVVVRALAVACGVVAFGFGPGRLLAQVPQHAASQAPPAQEEIGTLQWGAAVVWLRATDAGVVDVYASTGYRSAFAQPVALDTAEAERWAALLDQLTNPPPAAAGSTATPDSTDARRVTLGGGDLVLFLEPGRATEPKLSVWVGATRPDAVVAEIFPQTGETGALLLRHAAQRARILHNAAIAAAATLTAPSAESAAVRVAAVPAVAVVKESTATSALAAVSAPSETAVKAPVPPPPPAPLLPPRAETLAAVPQRILPPQVPGSTITRTLARSTTTPAGFAVTTSRVTRSSQLSTTVLPVATTKTATPLHIVSAPLAGVTVANNAPRLGSNSVRSTPAAGSPTHPSGAGAVPAAPSGAGVDDATVQNLVEQWRPELMYCYTQFGLRAHASLTGALTIRARLTPTGTVQQVVIGSRRWVGEGGADVEACVQSRVAAWHFPPAPIGSVHEFSMEFR